ncbi:zinc ribbon domain-containing protein [Schaalia suimastitidis]|uniref:zinc ribbon domain-containing protein n=1 Tax=Schaalia suimastitidis TaxID=121163 RepID=UPI00040B3B33|nr:zinc ribbon domain-containing protein [Schaalia suimastitidis]
MDTPHEANAIDIFKIAPSDVAHLARQVSITPNPLSPYWGDGQEMSLGEPSQYLDAIMRSPHCVPITHALVAPLVKIECRRGGSVTAPEHYQVLLSRSGGAVVAHMRSRDGEVLVLHFANAAIFVQWWLSISASSASYASPPLFSEGEDLHVFLCLLHSIDMYQRAYFESMLDYRPTLDETFDTLHFVDLFRRSLASRDWRWQIPTLLGVLPELEQWNIELLEGHLERACALGFLTRHEAKWAFGDRVRLMGTEVITSWLGSTGAHASVMMDGNRADLSSLLLMPTAITNHLFTFLPMQEHGVTVSHHSYSTQEATNSILTWFAALYEAAEQTQAQPAFGHGEAGIVPPSPGRPVARRVDGAVSQVCGNCRAELHGDARFCPYCGTPVVG